MRLKPGDELRVRDALDTWIPALVAERGVEGTHRDGRKIHDFPVVWVGIAGADGPVAD
jgi:hypothetical protein